MERYNLRERKKAKTPCKFELVSIYARSLYMQPFKIYIQPPYHRVYDRL